MDEATARQIGEMQIYEVLTKEILDELEDEVNARFKEGWQLAGGIAIRIIADNDGHFYYRYFQAMTLKGQASDGRTETHQTEGP